MKFRIGFLPVNPIFPCKGKILQRNHSNVGRLRIVMQSVARATPFLLAALVIISSSSGCIGNSEQADEQNYLESLSIAAEINPELVGTEQDPNLLANFLSKELNADVTIYPVQSEGAMIEALRFGHADIALMSSSTAWMSWKEYGLEVLGADEKSDGRAYYNANAWVKSDSEMALAHLDDDPLTDPFALLSGKTSCHTGWLDSVGMMMPMGFLLGLGYANIIGDPNDVESLRNTIHSFFNDNSSIPESGTPYFGFHGALRCLSDGTGDVAFVKDTTVDTFCADDLPDREDWCLERSEYVSLTSFGKAPSSALMYNPEFLNQSVALSIASTLVSMSEDPESSTLLLNTLNSPGIISTNAQEHLGGYSAIVVNIPGMQSYFTQSNGDSSKPNLSLIRIAFGPKQSTAQDADFDSLENYLESSLEVDIEVVRFDSNNAMIENLSEGEIELAFIGGIAAWSAWKQNNLSLMAAVQNPDERIYSFSQAWVRSDSEIAAANNDNDPLTDPFALLADSNPCLTGLIDPVGALIPMSFLVQNQYSQNEADSWNPYLLQESISSFFDSHSLNFPAVNSEYYGVSGALRCLSEESGDVAIVTDSTVETLCGNTDSEENQEWCLEREEYVGLQVFGKVPGQSVMYNPVFLDVVSRTAVLNSLTLLNYEIYLENFSRAGTIYTGCYDFSTHVIDEDSPKSDCGSEILANIFDSPGIVRTTPQVHLGSFSQTMAVFPGLSVYVEEYPVSDE